MQTTGGPPMGRERRRKDLYGRVRRFLYGLLLLAAAPGAAAIDELAGYGRYRIAPTTVSDPAQRIIAVVQGLIVLRAAQGHDDAHAPPPQLDLETVTARIQEADAEPAPQALISAVRNAGGFDVALAEAGVLRLDVRIGAIQDEHAWSIGGTLAHHGAQGRKEERKVAEVPAVRVRALHSRETRYLPFEVSVRESQLGFKWRI